jgi:hypothetical protein
VIGLGGQRDSFSSRLSGALDLALQNSPGGKNVVAVVLTLRKATPTRIISSITGVSPFSAGYPPCIRALVVNAQLI